MPLLSDNKIALISFDDTRTGMSSTAAFLVSMRENVSSSDEVDVRATDQVDANSAGTGSNDRLAKIRIGSHPPGAKWAQ